jgi:hypothetical protein
MNLKFFRIYSSIKIRKEELDNKLHGSGYRAINNTFKDLILQYKGKKYNPPDLNPKNNLFNQSPLLMENYHLVKDKVPICFKVKKNTHFLNKLKNHADDLLLEKVDGNNYDDLEKFKTKEEVEQEELMFPSVGRLEREIKKTKKNIYITKMTIESPNNDTFYPDSMRKSRNLQFLNFETEPTCGTNLSTDVTKSPKNRGKHAHTKPIRMLKPIKSVISDNDLGRAKTHKEFIIDDLKPKVIKRSKQLEKLYDSIDVNNLGSIDEEGIIDYFANFRNDKLGKLMSHTNLDANSVIDTVKEYRGIVKGLNFNDLNKNYFRGVTDSTISKNAEKVM